MPRPDGRLGAQLRPVRITRHFTKYAEGSVLFEIGDTQIICNATVDDKVPPFLRGTGRGWVTAEYSMLPRATAERNIRDRIKGQISGRSHEIQRLIGRSLRAVVDLSKIGERTIIVDCDVLQADGGTRTAAITGGFVALVDALATVASAEKWERLPLQSEVAAVSVGQVDQVPLLDLCYSEDARAEVDMNVVMTGDGRLIEVQATAEQAPFSQERLTELLNLAAVGVRELVSIQRKALGKLGETIGKD